MKKYMIICLTFLIGTTSCVSIRKYEELQAKEVACQTSLEDLQDDYNKLDATKKELETKLESMQKRLTALRQDTTLMGTSYRKLTRSFDDLNESYEALISNNNSMLARNAEENRKLLLKLEKTEENLLAKEEALLKEQQRLDALTSKLELLETNLQEREKRVNELESALSRKDSIANAIKEKIAEALIRFENQGLTITQKNGKVYVSLENSLLFASGSWTVDAKGQQAIADLAQAMSENKDVDILIEGHTDSDAFNGSTAIKDNWDLSVMRATAIVKILTSNGVSPERLTAAGRSEYVPVASNDTSEGKAANRRIEIIISPDLGAILDIISN